MNKKLSRYLWTEALGEDSKFTRSPSTLLDFYRDKVEMFNMAYQYYRHFNILKFLLHKVYLESTTNEAIRTQAFHLITRNSLNRRKDSYLRITN